ncbi:MAG: menaquinone biosynthesis protein [Verrucomicrobiota bacterium]|nr:menaquinone biosynthesis protein [Verrucomicrobiota bacterium]
MKIASVPYFNAKPLIHGLNDVLLLHPADLACKLREGAIDIGLVPVMEVLEEPGLYDILDGFSISSRGPVQSVVLAHRIPVQEIRAVNVDIHSKTSATLVKIVCERFFGIKPEYIPFDSDGATDAGDAVMLIGDQALKFIDSLKGDDWQITDLGAVWKEFTGLPFVYAVWAARKNTCNWEVFDTLKRAKEEGLAHLDAICAGKHVFSSTRLAMNYLTKNIYYDLNEEEKEGLHQFQKFLMEDKKINVESQLNYINFD